MRVRSFWAIFGLFVSIINFVGIGVLIVYDIIIPEIFAVFGIMGSVALLIVVERYLEFGSNESDDLNSVLSSGYRND